MNEDKDFPTRRSEFMAEYKTLIDKYHVDFLSTPFLVPTERGTWSLGELQMRVEVIDTTAFSTPSPLQFQNIKF